MNEIVRLYILGQLGPNDQSPQDLTVLIEHRGARAIERLQLSNQSIAEIEQRVDKVRNFIEFGTPSLAPSDIEDLGSVLAGAVLVKRVKAVFDGAAAAANIMPLEIFVEDRKLSTWPWEYLYDMTNGVFVCENFQPICRGVFSAVRDPLPRPPPDKLRILLLVGVDSVGASATPDTEVKWISEVFQTALDNGLVDIRVVRVFDPDTFQRAIVNNDHDVLHYYGHGDFDDVRQEAYLALQQRGGKVMPFYAQNLATTIMGRNTRLVFLNACNTGKTSASADLIRSGLAPALVNKGVPAVVATQFVLPDVSAHRLSAMVYNSIAQGNRLVNALREGRQAMRNALDTGFVDWGIPVLYTRDGTQVLRAQSAPNGQAEVTAAQPFVAPPAQRSLAEPSIERPYVAEDTLAVSRRAAAANTQGVLLLKDAPKRVVTIAEGEVTTVPATPATEGGPSLIVARTVSRSTAASRRRVALIDIDSKVAFLPDLADAANKAQSYYHFAVAYLPCPSGAVRRDLDDEQTPQLYLPRVRAALEKASELLGVRMACCLTEKYIAGESDGEIFYNYLASPLYEGSKVIFISTASLPELAMEADVSFAKAVLCVALSQIILVEDRWEGLGYHKQTRGCLFDFCEEHSDLVTGLKKMKFDDPACRSKIKDPQQLVAIDALLAIDIAEVMPE